MNKQPNYIIVTKKDLPLVCPRQIGTYKTHPQVTLAVEQAGTIVCPYCNVAYKFVEHYQPGDFC